VRRDLGIKGITVDDDPIRSVEQRPEHGQGAHLAGGVVEVEIGKNACEHRDERI
jgi:hypothetical protein